MDKLKSRKLGVVLLIIFSTIALAMTGNLSAEVSQVFTGLGVVYPAAQGYVDGKK